MNREKLGERVDARVERMWEAGLVAEVESLIAAGLLEGKTARAALGYAQLIAFKAGSITEEQAKEETKRATRQYVRRQETWFSRDQRITWLREDSDRLGIIEKAILGS
jgi:tRNA dimethylallyltransferase